MVQICIFSNCNGETGSYDVIKPESSTLHRCCFPLTSKLFHVSDYEQVQDSFHNPSNRALHHWNFPRLHVLASQARSRVPNGGCWLHSNLCMENAHLCRSYLHRTERDFIRVRLVPSTALRHVNLSPPALRRQEADTKVAECESAPTSRA